ncbi:hypothetical protein CR513_03048, partial [Mucuna pruriens]
MSNRYQTLMQVLDKYKALMKVMQVLEKYLDVSAKQVLDFGVGVEQVPNLDVNDIGCHRVITFSYSRCSSSNSTSHGTHFGPKASPIVLVGGDDEIEKLTLKEKLAT